MLGTQRTGGIFGGMSYALALSPRGRLFVEPDELAEPKLAPATGARITQAFAAAEAKHDVRASIVP